MEKSKARPELSAKPVREVREVRGDSKMRIAWTNSMDGRITTNKRITTNLTNDTNKSHGEEQSKARIVR
jgi:hypothetical protein